MTKRNIGLSSAQTLSWNGENRLVSVTGTGLSESYAYSPDGARVKKVSGGKTTYYINGFYEVEVTAGVATVVKYYHFNGQRIAMLRGAEFRYLYVKLHT